MNFTVQVRFAAFHDCLPFQFPDRDDVNSSRATSDLSIFCLLRTSLPRRNLQKCPPKHTRGSVDYFSSSIFYAKKKLLFHLFNDRSCRTLYVTGTSISHIRHHNAYFTTSSGWTDKSIGTDNDKTTNEYIRRDTD